MFESLIKSKFQFDIIQPLPLEIYLTKPALLVVFFYKLLYK